MFKRVFFYGNLFLVLLVNDVSGNNEQNFTVNCRSNFIPRRNFVVQRPNRISQQNDDYHWTDNLGCPLITCCCAYSCYSCPYATGSVVVGLFLMHNYVQSELQERQARRMQ